MLDTYIQDASLPDHSSKRTWRVSTLEIRELLGIRFSGSPTGNLSSLLRLQKTSVPLLGAQSAFSQQELHGATQVEIRCMRPVTMVLADRSKLAAYNRSRLGRRCLLHYALSEGPARPFFDGRSGIPVVW